MRYIVSCIYTAVRLCDFLYPISDVTQKSIQCTLLRTSSHSLRKHFRKASNSPKFTVLSKQHVQFQTRVQKKHALFQTNLAKIYTLLQSKHLKNFTLWHCTVCTYLDVNTEKSLHRGQPSALPPGAKPRKPRKSLLVRLATATIVLLQ